MPFLSTDLYIESQRGATIEQLARIHTLRPQEVEERIEAARLFFEVQVVMRDFPMDLMFAPARKVAGRYTRH